jgi:hypothetical protein
MIENGPMDTSVPRRLGHDLAVDEARAFHPAGLPAQLEHLELEPNLVSRHHRTAEFDVVERHEVNDLVVVVLPFEPAHQQHSTHLGHRLDDQDPRHNRVAWEMPLKELLVHGDVLDPDDPLLPLNLDDPVD